MFEENRVRRRAVMRVQPGSADDRLPCFHRNAVEEVQRQGSVRQRTVVRAHGHVTLPQHPLSRRPELIRGRGVHRALKFWHPAQAADAEPGAAGPYPVLESLLQIGAKLLLPDGHEQAQAFQTPA